MNTFTKVGYTWLWALATVSASISNAAGFWDITKADPTRDKWQLAKWSADNTIAVIVGNLLLFLGLIGVIYALWGGFLILTAAWNDDQVKKGRQVIVHAIIGIVVIFLSYSIINWVLTKLTVADQTQ